jgi:cell pole-organizing protein PopZ
VVLQNEGLVEESVRVVIRPIVKPWLEDNLAGIVESLVRQEIDRILRGRR